MKPGSAVYHAVISASKTSLSCKYIKCRTSRFFLAALCTTLLFGCSGAVKNTNANTRSTGKALEDFHIVDCLLPGKQRRLGQGTFQTPGLPIKTTAADCRIRGGEYTEFDRADYKTALRVWLPAAESGDPEAQVNVGEIFERGLGDEPNYKLAVFWYQKAADQGSSRAQFNLGTLYEQGQGVKQDKLLAMNFYRQAWGMAEDDIIFQSAAFEEQQKLRQTLKNTIDQKSTQIALLSKQIEALKTTQPENTAPTKEMEQLVAWVDSLEQQQTFAQNEMNILPRLRQPTGKPALAIKSTLEAQQIAAENMKFGRYYALIIANQNYDELEDLKTPHTDAVRAKKVLEEQYGFEVSMLLDADSAQTMRTVNEFSSKLTEEDNLLIFYAGHGSRIETGDYEAGYWLPVDAEPPPQDTLWVSNEFVTRHLSRIKAKRVLVVSDSCYAGLLSNAPGFLFMGENTQYGLDYIKYKLPKKSRLLISSGGDQPVLDNASGGNSVFASAFIDALVESEGIVTGPELFLKIRNDVQRKAKQINFEQIPELKVIKSAGHEVGDFFFVKKGSST